MQLQPSTSAPTLFLIPMFMALLLITTTTFFFYPFNSSSIASSYSFKDIQSWCNQTPYPQPCEYYLTNHAFNKPIKSKSDFLKVSLQLALERAQRSEFNTHALGPKCRNVHEKSAWADCLELYEYMPH